MADGTLSGREHLFNSRGMPTSFYDQPILNSPYSFPCRHYALDDEGQPLDLPPVDGRRRSKLLTPVHTP